MNPRTKLDDIEAFIALAEELSFSRCAQVLGLSKSVVTRRIQRLEDTLRTQLIERTTRKLKLTEEGQLYYDSLRGIPQTLKRAEERLQKRLERPVGHLKVILPSYLGSSIITRRVIPDFLREHPEVSLEVRLSDLGPFDIPKDFDVLVMTRLANHRLPDSSLKERKLGRLRAGLFASPAYLAERGVPMSPAALIDHECISYLSRQWRFKADGQPSHVIEVNGSVVTGSNEVIRPAVLSGCGIAYSFYSVFADELESKQVVPVLEEYTSEAGLDLRILTPGNEFTPLRVRLFCDAVSEVLNTSG